MKLQHLEVEVALPPDDKARKLFQDSSLLDSDIFIYNGDIHPALHKLLGPYIGTTDNKRAILLLTTAGGSADAAYRVARNFQESYDEFVVGVWGYCKSAGTLMAIGANELVIAPCGELGPLDVQIFSPDEFVRRSSGLSIAQAIKFVTAQAFEAWEENFLNVRQRSGGVITTKTAADIASDLAVGMFAPITEKIDPIWIGELQRSIDVAMQYGLRLGMPEPSLRYLIEKYPSHSFVIDYRDAEQLFKNVRRPNSGEELLFESILRSNRKDFEIDFLRDLSSTDLLFTIKFVDPTKKQKKSDENNNSSKNGSGNKPEKNAKRNNVRKNSKKKSDSKTRGTKKAAKKKRAAKKPTKCRNKNS